MNIRTAERRDLSAMLDIYNYEVKNGTATFDVEPRAGAAGEAWFAAHNTGNHPLLVAEEDGKVLGYASLSPYRDFDAYLQTVELSVYVAPESRGRGIASHGGSFFMKKLPFCREKGASDRTPLQIRVRIDSSAGYNRCRCTGCRSGSGRRWQRRCGRPWRPAGPCTPSVRRRPGARNCAHNRS